MGANVIVKLFLATVMIVAGQDLAKKAWSQKS